MQNTTYFRIQDSTYYPKEYFYLYKKDDNYYRITYSDRVWKKISSSLGKWYTGDSWQWEELPESDLPFWAKTLL